MPGKCHVCGAAWDDYDNGPNCRCASCRLLLLVSTELNLRIALTKPDDDNGPNCCCASRRLLLLVLCVYVYVCVCVCVCTHTHSHIAPSHDHTGERGEGGRGRGRGGGREEGGVTRAKKKGLNLA
jgi:hypothetical protein